MPSFTTHQAYNTVNVYLSTLARGQAGFSTVLLVVPLATNSLNGARVVEYTTLAAAQAAQTATYISAATLVAITTAFAQVPAITSIKVGYADLVGGETYATGLAACIAYDPAFYGVCIFVRTTTEIAAVAAYVETAAKKMLFAFQSADSSWLTGTPASGFDPMAAYERTFGVYHATATEWADVAYLCNRLTFDPDVQSAPWRFFEALDVAQTTITEAQRLLATPDINVMAEWSTFDSSPAPGWNMNGRPIEEVLTADWLATRLDEEIQRIVGTMANAGRKIGINVAGQAIIQAGLEKWLAAGVAAGHFEEGQVAITPEDFSVPATLAAAITAKRLTFRIDAQNQTSLLNTVVNVYANSLPVVA